MMTEKNVTELDMLGTDASHAFILIQNKFSDDIQWVEVEKVILEDRSVLITSVDDGYTDNTIDIARNMYVVSCSIRDLYETVYEELSKVNI